MAAKKAEEAEFLLAEHTRKEEMEKEKAERDRLVAEVMRDQSTILSSHPDFYSGSRQERGDSGSGAGGKESKTRSGERKDEG